MKVTLEDYKAIQELKAKGYSRNEATERSKYTQYVIYKFWDMPQDDFMDQVGKTKSACVPYRDFFAAELKENPFIPVSVLYDKFIEKVGVKVSQASVYRYVKDLRRRMGLTERQMRLTQIVADQLPGEEAQVDYGESQMLSMYGYSVKVYFFCMVLSHSRMKYVYFSAEPFDALKTAYAHELAFKYFDGMPKTIRYDQDRKIVVSENCGNVIYTKEFDNYRKAAGFETILCKPYDPDSKGKVETVVRFVKQNFLEGRDYCGIDRLNQDCLAWLDRTGNGLVHSVTRRIPREMWKDEVAHLIKHNPIKIDIYKNKIAVIAAPYIVKYKANRYSVPPSKCVEGDRVRLEEENGLLHVINLRTNEKIATHVLIKKDKGKTVVEREQFKTDYFKKAKATFAGSDVALKFLERIEISKPRYVKEQSDLLKRIQKEYSLEEILEAMICCMSQERYCMTEVLSELIIKRGERNLDDIAPIRTKKQYRNLAKYNILTGDKQ